MKKIKNAEIAKKNAKQTEIKDKVGKGSLIIHRYSFLRGWFFDIFSLLFIYLISDDVITDL